MFSGAGAGKDLPGISLQRKYKRKKSRTPNAREMEKKSPARIIQREHIRKNSARKIQREYKRKIAHTKSKGKQLSFRAQIHKGNKANTRRNTRPQRRTPAIGMVTFRTLIRSKIILACPFFPSWEFPYGCITSARAS